MPAAPPENLQPAVTLASKTPVPFCDLQVHTQTTAVSMSTHTHFLQHTSFYNENKRFKRVGKFSVLLFATSGTALDAKLSWWALVRVR